MASLIHLIRHGEVHNPDGLVYASLPGFGLSALGRSQAVQAARHLGSQPVVAVWSSPLERALETSGIIARRFGVPVRADERLTEWNMLDRWAGHAWADVEKSFPGELKAYLDQPHQVDLSDEPLAALALRMRGAIEMHAAGHLEGDVVIVSHQDPVQAARLSFAGDALDGLHLNKPGHCSIVTLRPGSTWKDLGMWTPESPSSAE